jgi:hypothetical protein
MCPCWASSATLSTVTAGTVQVQAGGGAGTTSLAQAEADAQSLADRLHEQYAVWKLVGLYNPQGSTAPMKGGEDDHC